MVDEKKNVWIRTVESRELCAFHHYYLVKEYGRGETQTESGLYLPETGKDKDGKFLERPVIQKILAKGPDCKYPLEVGDIVAVNMTAQVILRDGACAYVNEANLMGLYLGGPIISTRETIREKDDGEFERRLGKNPDFVFGPIREGGEWLAIVKRYRRG